jgi:hypothetical protein
MIHVFKNVCSVFMWSKLLQCTVQSFYIDSSVVYHHWHLNLKAMDEAENSVIVCTVRSLEKLSFPSEEHFFKGC